VPIVRRSIGTIDVGLCVAVPRLELTTDGSACAPVLVALDADAST
jgi:hypothetical protein